MEYISTQEMPALTSTVKVLEALARDETSSLQNLGQSLMHDSALTTSILRVANSAGHMGVSRITTVSRAAVVLGFKVIKNICITSKLLSSLLKNKQLTAPVYQRLVQLMAQSFYAALLARRMMAQYDEDTREEAFIAALLFNLGEEAFWSMGGELTEQLDQQLSHCDDRGEALIRDTLGVTFNKLTIGLANAWRLSDVLVRALKNPRQGSPQLQVIHLANQCSAMMSCAKYRDAERQALLDQMSDVMGLELSVLKRCLGESLKEAEALLTSYGARVLIPHLPRVSAFYSLKHRSKGASQESGEARHLADASQNADCRDVKADERYQLDALRTLAFMANEKPHFYQVVQTTLDGIYRGLGMDRVIFFMLSSSKQTLVPRQLFCQDSEALRRRFVIDISDGRNIFYFVLKNIQPVMISGHQDSQWGPWLLPSIKKHTSPTGFFLAPALLDKQCLGVFYADCAESGRRLSRQQFTRFTHFVQQANLCLYFSLKK